MNNFYYDIYRNDNKMIKINKIRMVIELNKK